MLYFQHMTKLPLALIVVSTFALAGCNKPAQPQGDQTQEQTQTMEQTKDQMTEQFQMVAEAMAAGNPIVCQMTNANGTSFTYSNMGQKIRIQGQLSPDSPDEGNMLSDGEFIYTWSNQNQQGIKFKQPSAEDLAALKAKGEAVAQNLPDFSDQMTQDEYKNQGYSINCTQENIPDDTFVPPTTVTFTDTSDMMQRAQQMMRQDDAESASEAASEGDQMDLEQVKKVMQGYGGQQ